MCIQTIDAKTFHNLILAGMNNLDRNKEVVNNLNVFPIPDGDTGDNMAMTMSGGAKVQVTESMTLAEAAEKISRGMLLSARGNSGVILSQLVAGIAKGLKDVNSANMEEMIDACKEGVRQAYSAVMTPTEGTMLTVSREATEATANESYDDFESLLNEYIREAKASLERTPSMLPILEEAGVVDSGGAGLVYILEGMEAYIGGEKSLATGKSSESSEMPIDAGEPDYDSFTEDTEMEYGYCTELLLRLQSAKTDIENFDDSAFVKELEKRGDSIVCIRDGSLVKIHIHTFTPYRVLEFTQFFGEYLKVKIENMMVQHSELDAKDLAPEKMHKDSLEESFRVEKKQEHKRYGIVCVANGDGICSDFKGFGVDEVINAGQTNNPSTEDFINTYEKINADDIFVLPNNGNIILAAEASSKVYKNAKIHVVPTHTIGDAYAILSMLELSSDNPEKIMEDMICSMDGVLTAEMSQSVRDTNMNGMNVKKDDYIGIFGKKIVSSKEELVEAAKDTLSQMKLDDHSMLIVIRGKDASKEEEQQIMSYLKKKYPYLEINNSDGMQDVYPFVFVAA